jgi:tetratricopeptide (TPR) repeat protein
MPLLLLVLAAPAFTQTVPPQLLQAQQLSDRGQSSAAIAILEPLVQEKSHELTEADRGIAWNLLGSAYRNKDDYDKARHCYEAAAHILSAMPTEQANYAAVLDNLGGVEELTGQYDAAKTLQTRAKRLYESVGNHAGIAIASSNLTQVALNQHDLATARRNMEVAFRQLQLAPEINPDNLAAIYTVKGALARSEQDFHAAIAADQQAIDIWTRNHGPEFYKLGVAYSLRGEAYGMLGDYRQAISDHQHALTLLEERTGRNSQAYLKAELAYAYTLRRSGSKQEATRLEKEAKTTLANIRTQQCSGCTISAESFR